MEGVSRFKDVRRDSGTCSFKGAVSCSVTIDFDVCGHHGSYLPLVESLFFTHTGNVCHHRLLVYSIAMLLRHYFSKKFKQSSLILLFWLPPLIPSAELGGLIVSPQLCSDHTELSLPVKQVMCTCTC